MPNLTTIEYDQPITNLIAGLNATGHITHGPYKKTGVTFHHNGGIFTHQEILNIWKTRPASAHFDVDADGAVAQFANAYDYAWACANTQGNESTISIEMCNATLAPKWLVSETTWRSAARLAGWLFANIIGEAPTARNIYFHHDWYPTACAGPYMDSVRDELVDAVQAAYRLFKGGKTPNPPAPTPPAKPKKPAKLAVDGVIGPKSTDSLEHLAGVGQDAEISGQPRTIRNGGVGSTLDACWPTIVYGSGGSRTIAWLQGVVGVTQDGDFGPNSRRGLQRFLGVKVDDLPGPTTCKALQRWINTQLEK